MISMAKTDSGESPGLVEAIETNKMYEGFPKALRTFLSADETRQISSPIITPEGWEATNGHYLAWQKTKHARAPKEPTFITGPNAGERGTGIAALRAELLHPYVLSFRVDVQAFSNWVGAWPSSMTLNLHLARGKDARAELIRHLNPKNKKTKGLSNITADATKSLLDFGIVAFDRPEYFPDSNGINAGYLADAVRFAGGYVYTRKDLDKQAPWIISPLAKPDGWIEDGATLLDQPHGVILMPVWP